MKRVDLSNLDIEKYILSIDVDKIRSSLKKLKPKSKFKIIIDELENIIKANVSQIETKYKNYANHLSKVEKQKVKDIFDYAGYRQKEDFMSFFKELGLISCPFCNNNHIYFFKQKAKAYNTLATLEHYYPKAKYPHLSLSFYNLIPCCSICNTKFKGNKTHEGNILHPYIEDFDELATFSISVNNSIIKKDEDIEVRLKANNPVNSKCLKTIERFNLDKIYEEHSHIAKSVWNTAQTYNESRIDELYNNFYKQFGYTKEDIKDMVYCTYLSKDKINKKNHSKLTQDILKQFELN